MDVLLSYLLIGIFLVLIIVIFFVFKALNREFHRQTPSQSYRRTYRRKKSDRRQAPLSRATAPAHLKKQLLRQLGGDQQVAQRLVEGIRRKYPDQNEAWCWEKALFDLKRDRH